PLIINLVAISSGSLTLRRFTVLRTVVNSQSVWNSVCDSHASRAKGTEPDSQFRVPNPGRRNAVMICQRCGGWKVIDYLCDGLFDGPGSRFLNGGPIPDIQRRMALPRRIAPHPSVNVYRGRTRATVSGRVGKQVGTADVSAPPLESYYS